MGLNNPLFGHLRDHDYVLTTRSYSRSKTKKPLVITELKALYNCKSCGLRTLSQTTMDNHSCEVKPRLPPAQLNHNITSIGPTPGYQQCLNNNLISKNPSLGYKQRLNKNQISKRPPSGYKQCLNNNQRSNNPTPGHEQCLNNNQIAKDPPPGYEKCLECNPTKNENSTKEIYACPKCSYFTHRATSLKVHMHIHLRETPYKCTECEYGGRDLKELIKHYNEVKNLQCDCGYATHVKQRMVSHIRTHTGEKPFTCKYCTFASATPGSLARHVTTKHCFKV